MHRKIGWNGEQLRNGCRLAGIAHAIMVAEYPLIANEHSWDGYNYSVQDSSGQRGTVSFCDGFCVAAFRNDLSERRINRTIPEKYFEGASEKILQIANEETLQYLLDEVDGKVVPCITTAFWGSEDLYTNDSFQEMMNNGGNLLIFQTQEIQRAMVSWCEYYGMDRNQEYLMRLIYDRVKNDRNSVTTLSKQEISLLKARDKDALAESRISFAEMGISWE